MYKREIIKYVVLEEMNFCSTANDYSFNHAKEILTYFGIKIKVVLLYLYSTLYIVLLERKPCGVNSVPFNERTLDENERLHIFKVVLITY